MKIKIIGHGPITSAQLDEILFGASTINRKNSLKEAMDKLINEVKYEDEKKYKAPICFDIQSITANHKKNAFTVVWGDGSHTIIHLQKGDVWDDEKALAMCFVKHMMGDTGSFNDIFTEEMPAKIKHIGREESLVEAQTEAPTDAPVVEEVKTEVDETVKVSKAVEAETAPADPKQKTLCECVKEFIGGQKKKTYDIYLEGLCTRRLLNKAATVKEVNAAINSYRNRVHPWLKHTKTPFRVWACNGNLYIDFGATELAAIPGLTVDEYFGK
jgi:hypothetical protein